MPSFVKVRSFLRNLFCSGRVEKDLDQEVHSHIEMLADENLRAGMPLDEAQRAARIELGGIEQVKDQVHEERIGNWLQSVISDCRYGFRQLCKSPGFTAVAILSLALGIGAGTAVFSLVNAILLRSLPVPNPQELRVLTWTGTDVNMTSMAELGVTDGNRVTAHSFTHPAFLSFREQTGKLADIFGFQPLQDITARVKDDSFTAKGMMVSNNFFSALAVHPVLGRPLDPQEDFTGAASPVLISYDWWQHHFSLDPAVVGQILSLDANPFTIVGVLPRDFSGVVPGEITDFYVPMAAHSQFLFRPISDTFHWFVRPMARLRPGVTDAQLQSALTVIFARDASAIMKTPSVRVEPGHAGLEIDLNNYRKPLLLLLAVVAMVILVACTNLAGLSLSRGAARQHELSVRAALGAARSRLIRQSLTESLLLALLGGALGVLLAVWGKTAISRLLSGSPDGLHYDISFDFTVLAFALLASFIAALLSGLLPALRAGRVDPLEGLRSRSAIGGPRLRTGKFLVVAQICLSLLLLTGAGLYVRTLINLTHINAGFRTENLLLFELNATGVGYDAPHRLAFYEEVENALAAIPGVRGAALLEFPLLDNIDSWGGVGFPSRPPSTAEGLQTHRFTVGDNFFPTMGIPIKRGRSLLPADSEDAPKVIVVNEAFVREYFPKEDPIGRMVTIWGADWRVVGVCGDSKLHNIRDAVPPTAFLPFRQRLYGQFRETHLRGVYFALRTALPPQSLVDPARKAIAQINTGIPLANISTQQGVLDQTISQERLFATLCTSLAVLALLLCCIGLYGLMAYYVARRTNEFAIRMALGATRQRIAIPILREAFLLAAAGLALGIPAAVLLTTLIKAQLYGVAPNDPVTLLPAAILLIAVALLAAYIPARRATRIDPILALRYE
jgi:predicted permease